MRLLQSREKRQAADGAQEDYGRFLALLHDGSPADVHSGALALKESGVAAALSGGDRKKLGMQAFRAYADTALADDILTTDEESAFFDVCDAVGVGDEDLRKDELFYRLAIAKVNDGRLEQIDEPHVMTKKGETVHLEMVAALMKEVALREFRGGSQGVSIPIMKGVRYRTSSFRGHSVVVGTELQVADSGVLAVTSTRIVFLGQRKTLEIPYPKLVGVEVFKDGIRLSASNRQNAPLFRVESGDVVAATVNAAVDRLNT